MIGVSHHRVRTVTSIAGRGSASSCATIIAPRDRSIEFPDSTDLLLEQILVHTGTAVPRATFFERRSHEDRSRRSVKAI